MPWDRRCRENMGSSILACNHGIIWRPKVLNLERPSLAKLLHSRALALSSLILGSAQETASVVLDCSQDSAHKQPTTLPALAKKYTWSTCSGMLWMRQSDELPE